MKETPEQIETHMAEVRQHRQELQEKIEQTRALLAKADARRAAEPQNRASWDQKLNQLEATYSQLKREFELAKMDTERLEQDLADQKIGVDISLDSMIKHADPEVESAPPVQGDAFEGRGAVRIISTPLNKLAILGEERIAKLEAFVKRSDQLTAQEQEATLVRLNLARELSSDNAGGDNARRQFVLRASIDKIQRNLIHEVTKDEADALNVCFQRLAQKPSRTEPEERLVSLIGGAMKQLQREA